jgi:polysaccharide biosynthesis transport protein
MSYDRITNPPVVQRARSPFDVRTPIPNSMVPSYVEAPPDSVGLSEVTAPLWRAKRTILAIAIVGLAIGQAVSILTKPTYRARTSLQIEGFNNDQFMHEVSLISPVLPNATPENYLQNEVKVLESETLAKRVADQIGLPLKTRRRTWFNFLLSPQPSPEERRIKDVQKALTVRTSLQSQVVELFYDAPDPAFAARGANVAAAEFINLNREARWQLAQDTTDWLNKQTAALKATLENDNRELQDFALSTGLVFAGKQSTLAEDRMRQVQDALTKAEDDRAAKQARYEAAKARPDDLTADVLAAGPLKEYETDLQNLRRELAQLQTLYTPTNYRVQKVQAQIAETERAIKKEREEILDRMQTEYAAASGLENLLSSAQARQMETVQRQMDNERRYEMRKSQIDATERLYESMLEKVKEAGAAAALRTTNVRVIDSARVPSIPYSPNPVLNMAIGLAIGTLSAIGLVLAREDFGTVRRPGESNLLDVPELGVIPSARDAQSWERVGYRSIRYPGRIQEIDLSTDRDTSVMAESFRSALTSILFGAGYSRKVQGCPASGRALVITSIDVMEGKTTVLTNLGIAAAERKQRVLLIDADLRRPRVHELVNVSNAWGLADLLKRSDFEEFSKQAAVEDLFRPTHIPNLSVLPGGPVEMTSPSLLYASDLSPLLERFREEFDLILIDTPPMMLYADGRLLGRLSEGVVMVVRAATRTREELQAAYLRLVQDQIPVLGTILNDWKMDRSEASMYGRYHQHYYPSA